jgi:hypothetical protein
VASFVVPGAGEAVLLGVEEGEGVDAAIVVEVRCVVGDEETALVGDEDGVVWEVDNVLTSVDDGSDSDALVDVSTTTIKLDDGVTKEYVPAGVPLGATPPPATPPSRPKAWFQASAACCPA